MYYNISYAGSFVNDKTTFGASGRLNWDGKLRYEINANVQSQKTGQETLYTPSLLIRLPGQDSIDVTGSIKLDHSNYFETDMSINGFSSHPVTIKGKHFKVFANLLICAYVIVNSKIVVFAIYNEI